MQAPHNAGDYNEQSKSLYLSDYVKRSIGFIFKNVKRQLTVPTTFLYKNTQ